MNITEIKLALASISASLDLVMAADQARIAQLISERDALKSTVDTTLVSLSQIKDMLTASITAIELRVTALEAR